MMHPKRKLRLIVIPILLTILFSVAIFCAWFILQRVDHYTKMGENANNVEVAKIVLGQLVGSYIPLGTSPFEWKFHEFMRAESVRDRKVPPPQLPAPYTDVYLFVGGYQLHGKAFYDAPVLAPSRVPAPLINQLLTSTKHPINGEYWQGNDSNWDARLARFVSHDTTYFHAVLVDLNAAFTNLPRLFDSTLNKMPISFHVPPLNRPKNVDQFRYDELRVVVYDENRVLYQRGDTTNCKPIYTVKYDPKYVYFPNHKLTEVVFRENHLDWATNLRKETKRLLIDIVLTFVFLLFAVFELGFNRGYSIYPKRRAKEKEWERDHSEN